jgi:hypothetical protein
MAQSSFILAILLISVYVLFENELTLPRAARLLAEMPAISYRIELQAL